MQEAVRTAAKLGAGGVSSKVRPSAAPVDEQVASGLQALLASEERVRGACDETELAQVIVNETRRLIGARQVFLMRLQHGGAWRASAVSSMALVDRDTPLVRWSEDVARRAGSRPDKTSAQIDFALPAFADQDAEETKSYPFSQFAWQPLHLSDGREFAGLLAAREQPWRDEELKLLRRQAGVYANAWQALHGGRGLLRANGRRRWLGLTAGALLLAAAVVPVPMTTLAPVEIIAEQPEVVTAPIDGVVKAIAVDPNRQVQAGTVLFRFEDTVLSNRLELANREMRVAQARYERAEQAALSDLKARHDLLIAKTDYQLKKAERDYAASLRAKSIVRARRPGLVIYTSREEWLGRPVTTGEKIMSVADPSRVLARVELPVADAIALSKGAGVRLFLDAAPLNAVKGQIINESYHAAPNSSNQLVYTLLARISLGDGDRPPRIGARGTAQVFGSSVPLVFFLLRRPISFVRQSIGF